MKQYIGIDVGKYELEVFDGHVNLTVKNTDEGIKEMINHLCQGKTEKVFVVFEATGGYEQRLSTQLAETRIAFKRVHPNKVRHYAKAIGYLAKTDKIDAQLLTRFAESQEIQESDALLDEETAYVKALTVRREQLVEEKVKEMNRLDKLATPAIIESLNQHIAWLTQAIKGLEEQMKKYIDETPRLKKQLQLYQSIKGIGLLTAVYLLTHVPELGTIEHGPLASLVGVAPMNSDSGKKKGKRKIQSGRANIRKVLYMATLSAIRHNQGIKSFYERLLKKGKLFKVAMTAAMRKLIILVNAVAKRGTEWQEKLLCH